MHEYIYVTSYLESFVRISRSVDIYGCSISSSYISAFYRADELDASLIDVHSYAAMLSFHVPNSALHIQSHTRYTVYAVGNNMFYINI